MHGVCYCLEPTSRRIRGKVSEKLTVSVGLVCITEHLFASV